MVHLRSATYRFATEARPSLGPIDLDIRPGEVVLLVGPTGSGKSTLLRLACGLAGRHGLGVAGGVVRLDGRDPASFGPHERVRRAGLVTQEPMDQVLTGRLDDEVAFGLEAAGLDARLVASRVSDALRDLGWAEEPERSPRSLSGGQVQRLLVAAALAGGAGLLMLDEPLSQLDPRGATEVLAHVRRLATRGGAAILLVEHRLEACWPFVDRVVAMDRGEVCFDGPRDRVAPATLERLGLQIPSALAPGAPFRVGESAPVGRPVLRTDGLRFAYPGRGGRPALRVGPLELSQGERVAILGANGSGKSTLLKCFAGALDGGRVWRSGSLVDVPQNPDLALFCGSVREEVAHGPSEQRRPAGEVAAVVRAVAEDLSIGDLLDRAPQALSRGQRLRVAVGAALACSPDALLLDEPTSGQDRVQVERMFAAMAVRLRTSLLVFATHDVPLALRMATRVLVLEEGRITQDGTPGALAGTWLPTRGVPCSVGGGT